MDSFCGSKYWDLNKTWHTDNPDFTSCFQDTALTWTPCALFWLLSLLLVIMSAVELIISLANISTIHANEDHLHFSGEMDANVTDFIFSIRMAYCPIIICQFILSCFADVVIIKTRDAKEVCPKNTASILSILTFWWVNPLIHLGYKRPLTLLDMWSPNRSFLTDYNLKNFNKHYYKLSPRTKVFPISANFNVIRQENEIKRSSGILIPLLKTYWAFSVVLVLFRLANSLLTFVNPVVLDWLISFVSDMDQPEWRGYLYAFILFFSSMVVSIVSSQSMYYSQLIRLKMRACITNTIYRKQSIVSSQSMYYSQLIRLKMRACITNTIYRKSLLLSTDGRKSFTIGEIVNLMTMDTFRIVEFVPMVNNMWSAP
ncbi:unnamed protein product [Oppiella nova]|uniref:ABC transmembrane type-1 domain-containing protein n=1 Tax=Oppiella nova TaxID=334625 RepID=A0A7R9QJD6_9ACAR|nr:unnamed protein product [Oppiella nova]CAG2166522.1 unnamed protein product [Oppiella nova]